MLLWVVLFYQTRAKYIFKNTRTNEIVSHRRCEEEEKEKFDVTSDSITVN